MAQSRSARSGSGSEAMVYNVLNHLKAKGIISDFHQAKPKGTRGYDFSIELLPRHNTVLLQVKSSIEQVEKHKQKYPEIPCVVVPRHPLDWTKWGGYKQAYQILTERILTALRISTQ